MNQPLVCIIVVGYNSRTYLQECLQSVHDSHYANYQVIFVDNNSSDDSVEYIQENYPKVKIIASKSNNGFAKGNNIGIKKAMQLGAQYVFLLNPDTLVDKDCLKVLMEKANNQTIMQPLILLHDGKKKTNLINTSGNVLHYLGYSWCGDYKKSASLYENISEKEITGASGAGMFIPVDILKKIGLFDEVFFMYHEDIDLSWRAHISGYKVKIVPRAKMWHKYSFSRNKNKIYFIERNRFIFLIKCFQFKTLLILALAIVISEISLLLFFCLSGHGLQKLKAYWSVITLLSYIQIQREKISRIRSKTDSCLKSNLYTRLDFEELKTSLKNIFDYFSMFYWWLINKII